MDHSPVASKIAALFSNGPVSFERFMEMALYDPQIGYYAANIRTVGTRGDFSTSATLHAILGAAIAKWLAQFPSLPVIEIGAGNGALAKSIFNHLSLWRRFRIHYHIVEISQPLKGQQQAALRGKRVFWHEDMQSALAACEGEALIFSNELVDAFPCRVLVKKDGSWHELALELVDGAIQEKILPASLLEQLTGELNSASHKDGQRIEIPFLYREWLQSWLPAWQKGEMLTIDYGGLFPQLYQRRPAGTLRGYFHHQRMEGAGLYQNVGKQDITADVNFSLLQAWGEELGLKTAILETQRDFMRRLVPKITKSKNSAAQYLLQQPGPGDAFMALHQQRT